MSTLTAGDRPGAFAERRFTDRRRAWRRRVFWVFPVALILPLVVVVPIALLTHVHGIPFLLGLAIGGGAGAVMVLCDSPPAYIENWRTGADGEKKTAKALGPLRRQGWRLFNDIDTGGGNIDHVLVGPPGVFLLETKRLAGRVSVERGRLSVRWHEDPEHGYWNTKIVGQARTGAAMLRSRLAAKGIEDGVQAVVVLWSDFAQGSVRSGDVAWVQGSKLRSRLAAQPLRYSSDELAQLIGAVESTLAEIERAAPSRAERFAAASGPVEGQHITSAPA